MRVTILIGMTATICVALCAAKSLPSAENRKSFRSKTTEGVEDSSYESPRYQEEHFSRDFEEGENTPHKLRKDIEWEENVPHRSQKANHDEDGYYYSHKVVGENEDTPHKSHRDSPHRSRKPNRGTPSRRKVGDDIKPSAEIDDIEESSVNDDDDVDPATKELLAIARQHAIQVIVEKMLIAFGPDFMPQPLPNNDTMPTVSSPLNITTEPCPEIYAQCSSQNLFSSCKPPRHSHKGLWKQRFNLYFELPNNLLENDELLSATLRIYKHNALPLKLPTPLIVEVYSYTKSLTLKRDWNILINSTRVSSDFIGWVSLDLTDLIRNLEPKRNHGFLIKVRDENGILWNAPEHFLPMNCSDSNKSLVPVPFGVMTEEPEQKYPSLTIHTGKTDHYYSELADEESQNYEDDSVVEYRKEEISPQYEEEEQVHDYFGNEEREMPSDDPSVHRHATNRFNADGEEIQHIRYGHNNVNHHNHPHSLKVKKTHERQQIHDKNYEQIEEKRTNLASSITSIEEESVSTTKQWKKLGKDSSPAIYETQVTVTRKKLQPTRKKHQTHHDWESVSRKTQPNSEEDRQSETRHRHPRQRRSYDPQLQLMS